ncbi:MAG: PEP-utilizing enzyme [Elusimicrobiota bacterium]|nr:PEP-utilizing enzyme [Elusimicrobiota bacterium]
MRFLTPLLPGLAASETGGKAAGLRALGAAGFKIPDCRVITVKTARRMLRGAGRAFLPAPERELRAEAAALWPGAKLIARSSARLEDLPGSSAAGIYGSFAARDARALPGAVLSCLSSSLGARAKAYGRARGKGRASRQGMAVLVHPYLEAEFGGVCAVYQGRRAVIELSRLGPEGVTSGRGVAWRGFYDFSSRKWSGPAGKPRIKKLMLLALNTALRAQRDVVRHKNMAMEFLCGRDGITVLQARPLPAPDPGGGLMDMALVYLKISRLLKSLGLAADDWSLLEASDLLAFNYLGARRPASERLEHFCVMLRRGGISLARRNSWIGIRGGGAVEDVFPPPGDRRARLLFSAAAKENLLFIFRLSGKNSGPVKRERFRSGGVSFSMPFSCPRPRFGREEGRFLRLRLDAESARRMLGRLDGEARDLRHIAPALGGGAYERLLRSAIKARLGIVAKERKAALSVFRSKAPAGGVEGLPLFPGEGFVNGPLVVDRDILKTRLKRFIYAAPDFEPSFVSYARRIAAVVVSRGALCSHAAALCAEFKIPLIVEARNLKRLATGDTVSINLGTGGIEKI